MCTNCCHCATKVLNYLIWPSSVFYQIVSGSFTPHFSPCIPMRAKGKERGNRRVICSHKFCKKMSPLHKHWNPEVVSTSVLACPMIRWTVSACLVNSGVSSEHLVSFWEVAGVHYRDTQQPLVIRGNTRRCLLVVFGNLSGSGRNRRDWERPSDTFINTHWRETTNI